MSNNGNDIYTNDFEQLLLQEQVKENSHNSFEDPVIKKNRNKELNMLKVVFTICIVLIVERIFSETLSIQENSLLESIQQNMGMIQPQPPFPIYSPTHEKPISEVDYVKFKSNILFSIIGFLSILEVQFMFLTTFFIALYVGVNAYLTAKVMYASFIGYISIACLQMIYESPRPYWTSKNISTPICLQSYSQPSTDIFMIIFLIFYTTFCFKNENLDSENNVNNEKKKKNILITRIILSLITFIYFFLRFILAQIYLTEIIITCLYSVLFYYSYVFMDYYIDNVVQKTTKNLLSSKRYTFYWFFASIVMYLFAACIYSSSESFVKIDWIENYILCQRSNGKVMNGVPSDELIGPWNSFMRTTYFFSLVSCVFAQAHCFRQMEYQEWYKGSIKLRIIRVLVAWLTMIPSFILVFGYENAYYVQIFTGESGRFLYTLDSIHFVCLNFWLFGLMPLFLFKKLNILNKADRNDSFSQINVQPEDLNQEQNQVI